MHTLLHFTHWELLERPLEMGPEAAAALTEAPADYAASVPGDVSDALVTAGAAPEPLVGLNFRPLAERVKDRSWWYRTRFTVSADQASAAEALLELNGLDVHADIWLNGDYLGHHPSAFLPFQRDVKAVVRTERDNVLLVRLTTGAERVREHADFPLLDAVPTEEGRGYPDRGLRERIFLRKPAYVWGWDWSPHLPSCGITGPCSLRFAGVNAIANVFLRADLDGDDAQVAATVELTRHTLIETAWGRLVLRLTDESGTVHEVEARDVLVGSGTTIVPLTLTIPSPRLWWPNGSGEQHRYQVEAILETEDGTVCAEPFRWGLRTVTMENRPGLCRFLVNGQPIFIQGGNWIPCDHLHGRITPQRLEHLVAEAAEAHFNCLRIWGGGRYELDAFYEACDRHGILLWHDFMSACAPLPGDDSAFADLFCRESEYQVRRLHNRACLLLWCGNNEVGGCYEWFPGFKNHRDPAWPLYFERLPRLVHAHASHIPYWPTSPYGGGKTVGDLTVGDDHHWVVMRPEEIYWSRPEYWDGTAISIFNSEYGYGGPCSRTSTEAYLGTSSPDLFGETGREHTNSFYNIPRVNFSIKEHYCDPEGLSLDDYILYGGLCQGLNLGYSLESMRANRQTWGGLFWMYNDAWGENGWTIIDYYLRRKVSYYNVRRCLAPQRLVLRRGGEGFGGNAGEVLLLALNASPEPLCGEVRVGYLSYDGPENDLQTVSLEVAPRTNAIVAVLPEPAADQLRRGTVVAIPAADGALEPVAWRHTTVRAAALPATTVRITGMREEADLIAVTVKADGFAHAVSLNLGDDARPSDHYFDLLPGESRTVTVRRDEVPAAWQPQVQAVNAGIDSPV
jgi:beta-mannosidase